MALSQAVNSGMRFFSISHQINRGKTVLCGIGENAKRGL